MGADTKIQWAHHTFSPWIGCKHVSEGCRFCYAEVNTFTRTQRARGIELWGVGGARHVVSDAKWTEVFRWNRAAEASSEQVRVFPSMCDWLEDRDDLVEPRDRFIFAIENTPALTWLLLTKRPENAERLLPARWWGEFPRNLWFGFSAEDQLNFDARWAEASQVPGALLWCSYEPALGPIDFDGDPYDGLGALRGHHAEPVHACGGDPDVCSARCPEPEQTENRRLSWVVVGGESGPHARPFDPEWMRSAVRQCREAGVAAFCKQWGSNVRTLDCDLDAEDRVVHGFGPECLGDEIRLRLRDSKGGDPNEWGPGDWPREFPA